MLPRPDRSGNAADPVYMSRCWSAFLALAEQVGVADVALNAATADRAGAHREAVHINPDGQEGAAAVICVPEREP